MEWPCVPVSLSLVLETSCEIRETGTEGHKRKSPFVDVLLK